MDIRNNVEISNLWRIIKIGEFSSMEPMEIRLIAEGFFISKWAKDLAKRGNTFALDEPVEVGAILVTIRERPISYGNLCDGLSGLGKQPCPHELAYQMCLQYPHRPNEECLRFASRATLDKADHSVIFRVQSSLGVKGIYSQMAHDNYFFCPGETLVFVEKIKNHS